jgi:hypothetical protein
MPNEPDDDLVSALADIPGLVQIPVIARRPQAGSAALRRRALDRDGGAGGEQVGLAPDGDLQRVSFVEEVLLVVVAELDPDLPAVEPERERELCPAAGQGGREGQLPS